MNLKADMLSDINQEIVESVEFLEEAEKESAASDVYKRQYQTRQPNRQNLCRLC